MSRIVVLHVLESYGGGSAAAAEGYARATPEITHLVLRAHRDGEFTEGQDTAAFDEVFDLPRSPLAAVRRIRAVIRSTQPDWVHAHSSYAGAYVRVAVPIRQGRRHVVYTPHCFASERRDIGLAARTVYRAVEAALAVNTNVIAACSPREQALARRFPTRRRPVLVPNVPADTAEPTEAAIFRPGGALVSIGRMSAQKDPELFARIAAACSDLPRRPMWIGSGPEALEAELAGVGVAVTGWLSAADLNAAWSSVGVYLHTAAWEGMPLVLLDAANRGVPIVARSIPALTGAPREWLFDQPEQAVEAIGRLAEHPAVERNVAAWRAWFAENTSAVQTSRLRSVYDATAA